METFHKIYQLAHTSLYMFLLLPLDGTTAIPIPPTGVQSVHKTFYARITSLLLIPNTLCKYVDDLQLQSNQI